jgi:hypothetical protein
VCVEFNDFNGAVFNIRARALNNLVYWLSQIVGSVSIGFLLDQQGLGRRLRAFSGWAVLVVMVFVVHTWAYFYQKWRLSLDLCPINNTAHLVIRFFFGREYTRALVKSPGYEKIDIFDDAYVGRVFLYICCGLLDSMWQTTAYWLMGAMSNNPAKLAHFSGFCEFLLLLFFLLCSFFVRKG